MTRHVVSLQEEAAEKRRQDIADQQEKRQRMAAQMAADNRLQMQIKVGHL